MKTSSRDERGAATAEAAMVIPMLVLVAFGLCWVVSLGVAQVRVVDAAREAARSLARGDAEEVAVGLARQVAPGSSVEIDVEANVIRVTVEQSVDGPQGLLSAAGFTARAQAVAGREDTG